MTAKSVNVCRFVEYVATQAERAKNLRKMGQEDRAKSVDLALRDYVRAHGPSGSGFDAGTDLMSAGGDKIVLFTKFHHMDDHGCYCGWTDHRIVVKPTFLGPDISISGPNKNDIKDLIQQTFYAWLIHEQAHPALVEKT